jgi:hypothetical protein
MSYSYRKVMILVEGQTEEMFVKEVLQPSMPKEIYLQPIILHTSKQSSGKKHRGGVTSYEKVRNEIKDCLRDRSAEMITSMIDYYGLPTKFPNFSDNTTPNASKRVKLLEDAWEKDINDPQFKAYLSLHEFEALLFSDPEKIVKVLELTRGKDQLKDISDSVSTPEDINGGRKTHPSARLEKLYPGYRKIIDGIRIAKEIGIEKMMEKCPHFKDWVEFLKNPTGSR